MTTHFSTGRQWWSIAWASLFASLFCLMAMRSLGAEPRRLVGHSHPVLSLAFSGDGKSLASLSLNGVHPAGGEPSEGGWGVSGNMAWEGKVWDLAEAKTRLSFDQDSLPDNNTNRRFGELPEMPPVPFEIKISANGEVLALEGMGAQLQIWDVRSGKLQRIIRTLPKSNLLKMLPPGGFALSPDGLTVATTHRMPLPKSSVQLWNVRSGRPGKRLLLPGNGNTWNQWLEFSPDGQFLLGDGDGITFPIWNVRSGHQIVIKSDFERAIVTPSGKQLVAYTGKITSPFETWDIAKKSVATVTEPTIASDAALPKLFWRDAGAFSAAADLFAKVSSDGNVVVFRVDTGEVWRTLDTAEHAALSVALSPNGRLLAVGGFKSHDILLFEIPAPTDPADK